MTFVLQTAILESFSKKNKKKLAEFSKRRRILKSLADASNYVVTLKFSKNGAVDETETTFAITATVLFYFQLLFGKSSGPFGEFFFGKIQIQEKRMCFSETAV